MSFIADENTRLFRELQKHGKPSTREEIAKINQKLVYSIAHKYRRLVADIEDLYAAGNEGLVHAMNRYDVDSGHSFLTYAQIWIRRFILGAITGQRAVAGNNGAGDRQRIAVDILKQLNGVADPEREILVICENRGISAEAIATTLKVMMQKVVYLDAPLKHRDNYYYDSITMLDNLPYTGEGPDQLVESLSVLKQIQSIIEKTRSELSKPLEYEALERIIADDREKKSLQEVGEEFGVSREWVRLIEIKIRKKLIHRIEEAGIDPPEAIRYGEVKEMKDSDYAKQIVQMAENFNSWYR